MNKGLHQGTKGKYKKTRRRGKLKWQKEGGGGLVRTTLKKSQASRKESGRTDSCVKGE